MDQSKRLEQLRAQCQSHGVDGVIVPITNAFQGEYVPASDERLRWLTGFTGSNGMAIVLADKAAFFTDGRYVLQAEAQIDGAHFLRLNMTEDKPHEWLKANVSEGVQIAYDPWLHTRKQFKQFEQSAKDGGFVLKPCANLIDPLWQDRPAPPDAPVNIHPIAYAGVSSEQKRKEIAASLADKRADAVILSAGDSICWLFNIRGGDLPHTPFLLAYAILYADSSATLFFAPERLDDALMAHLNANEDGGGTVDVAPIDSISDAIAALAGKRVMLDPSNVASWFFQQLESVGAAPIESQDPCLRPKATKNATELKGAKAAHIRDGVAVTKFLHWFEQRVAQTGEPLTEIDAAARLEAFRQEQSLYQESSFTTISGYGPNGAIIHYRVDEASNLSMKPGSLYLVDSGGQYLDGTTDITRTLPVGEPTAAQREHFTLVLKGMIQLSLVKFPKGTAGGQLDILARHALWQAGLDYGHGTGHGIGSYLSVHEGPQGISHRSLGEKLAPGMLISNEPGYYLAGAYGIRIENVIAVAERGTAADSERPFYGFDTLTLAPISRHLIEASLLVDAEREWLNQYHQSVCDTLTPLLKDKACEAWLAEATAPI